MSVLGTLRTTLLCVCGPGNIPGAAAVVPDPMPNPWNRYVGTELQGDQEEDREECPVNATGPNLHAEPFAPNQSPAPEDPWNPVVEVPEWPSWLTKLDGRAGRRYHWIWDCVARTAQPATWTPPWVADNQDRFSLQRQCDARRHARSEDNLAAAIEEARRKARIGAEKDERMAQYRRTVAYVRQGKGS